MSDDLMAHELADTLDRIAGHLRAVRIYLAVLVVLLAVIAAASVVTAARADGSHATPHVTPCTRYVHPTGMIECR